MMAWLADKGPLIVLPVFMAMFFAFGFWAYRPKNRRQMESFGEIPLRESDDGEQ